VCYANENPLIEIPEEIYVEVCYMCGSYKRRTWQDPNERGLFEILDEIAYFGVKDNIKKRNKNIEVEIIPQEPRQLPGGKRSRVEIPTVVIATGKLAGEDDERSEERNVTVYLRMAQCPRCVRSISNYYEATLQVRAMNRFLTDEEKDELDNFVREEVAKRLKKDRMSFVSKFIIQKEGLDYQIGSMGGARNIASAIKSRYGGKITETAKLVGVEKDTGKNQYRITIAVRIPEYKIGDVVEYEGNPCKVLSMNENKIYLLKLDRREKISLNWADAEKNTKLLKRKDECGSATIISITPDMIMAMDDETYEVYEYDKIKFEFEDLKEGEKLRIFKKEGLNYIVDIIDN
jgi:nonsense-mediated mRNA decay protein 3